MIREAIDLFKYHNRFVKQQANHDYYNVFCKALRDLKPHGVNDIKDLDLLDVGCGQRFPFALLSANSGAKVFALDLNYVGPHGFLNTFYNTLQINGVKRAIKTIIRKILFDKKYYNALITVSDVNLEMAFKIKFLVANPELPNYPIDDLKFDLIISNAVIEHVEDVSLFASEVSRLLRKGGLFYGRIHNFYSLSGGHNMEWAYPDEHPSMRVPPWDHLRQNQYPTHVYLNKMKPEEYRKTFASSLDIVDFYPSDINHDRGGEEGSKILTPEMEQELKDYPRELLLKRSWCIICKK